MAGNYMDPKNTCALYIDRFEMILCTSVDPFSFWPFFLVAFIRDINNNKKDEYHISYPLLYCKKLIDCYDNYIKLFRKG